MNWVPSMCCCGRYEKRFVTNLKGKPSKVCRNCGRNDPNEFYVKNFMMNKEPKYDTFSVSVDDKPDTGKHYRYQYKGIQIDPYRIFRVYGITDPAIQHAVKKLLVAGSRGSKSTAQDIQESIDALARWQSMEQEDSE